MTRPPPIPDGSVVRIKSVPRGVDKKFVGKVGWVQYYLGRRKYSVMVGGEITLLTALRLEPIPHGPAEWPKYGDEIERAWALWPPLMAVNGHIHARPTLAEWRGEVEAVRKEYGGNGPVAVKVDGTLDRFTVTLSFQTEPITLEGVPLGPFRVTLTAEGGRRHPTPYFSHPVKALEPNPAAGTGGAVVHPHVFNDSLCLGEADGDWFDAMAGWRWADAADHCVSVLRHWSVDSAYDDVDLETWDGEPCDNCGERGGDRRSCSECGDGLCDACDGSFACRECGDPFHAGCAENARCEREGCRRHVCTTCYYSTSSGDGRYCPQCVGRCRGCGDTFCVDDLGGPKGHHCEDCRRPVCAGCGDRFDEDELEEGLCEGCVAQEEEASPAEVGGALRPTCFACGRRPGLTEADGRCVPCDRDYLLSLEAVT